MTYEPNNLILIVEDNPFNIQALTAVVNDCGFQSGVAMNGEEAFAFLEQKKPALILLDIMMPDIDGYEVCRRIKQNLALRDIPIIFLTAKSEKSDIIKGFEVGGVDYVTKPFNIYELKMRIYTHLELKQSRDRLVSLNKELRQSNATKDKFFSIVANDLRNPFNGIIGFTDFILHEFGNLSKEQIIHIVELVNNTSKDNYKLLEKLLEWSQLQTGNIKFNPVSVHLKKVADEAISSFADITKTKELSLISEIDDKVIVYCDYYMIYKVFQNLISNAVRFTQNGGSIRIVSQLAKEKNNQLFQKISIIDNSTGIDESIREKLFKIDEIVTGPDTDNIKGTGLGLILSKEFIEKNNGKIYVENNIKNGTQITFTIPEVVGNAATAAIATETFSDLNVDESDVELDLDVEPQRKQKKYLLPGYLWQQILKSLLVLLETQKIYLNPSLSLTEVAKLLNTNRVYLSQIINETYNCNFNQLINNYRIKDFIKYLTNKQNKLTIEALATQVGFKHKTSFNIAFKKFTGKTPSEYQKNQTINGEK